MSDYFLNKRFVDAMDRSRVVMPISRHEGVFTCRVYFNNSGFVGLSNIPKSLFSEEGADRWKDQIGFLMLAARSTT